MELQTTVLPSKEGGQSPIIVWFAVMSPFGETCCPAADLAQSLKVTTRYLRQYHLTRRKGDQGDVGPVDEDVIVNRIERDVMLYSTGMFVAGGATTESAAFAAWQLISRLEPKEARRRWRMGFPLPRGIKPHQDPLNAVVNELRDQVGKGSRVASQELGLCRA